MSELTPMMEQYRQIKAEYPDCILFFRLGDFYEMFWEDARRAARELDIALTSREARGREIPMAGVPCKSSGSYIFRLIEAGYSIAICEQVEDASQAKGLVEREVVRVITPGTVIEEGLLEEKENNYLAALARVDGQAGFAAVDISTGEFMATEATEANEDGEGSIPAGILDELDRLAPAECLIPDRGLEEALNGCFQAREKPGLRIFPEYELHPGEARNILTEHFGTVSLSGFGCEGRRALIQAAAMVLLYLQETQKRALKHISGLRTYSTSGYMVLDGVTRRNLELTATLREGRSRGSLLWVLDQTETAMGGRLLRRWIEQPLREAEEINLRLEAVRELWDRSPLREELRELLGDIYDIERLMGRLVYARASARDLLALRQSLEPLPRIGCLLEEAGGRRLTELFEKLDPLEDVARLIGEAVAPDPPNSLTEGGIIRDGYSPEVDRLRRAATEGRGWIARLEERERERTGINSLKVGYNKVFGYYIEVTRPNLDRVPEDYIRKQTLANSERYFTPELKEKESAILGSREKLEELEYSLFCRLRDKIAAETDRIQASARLVAELDVYAGLAQTALDNDYVCPRVDDGDRIEIRQGRHPVVELVQDEFFVPNDAVLDRDRERFLVITGPNMAGKSTYMRQVALLVLMAQMGSFVPAEEARIGTVDRIFTRVGASDDLTTGKSTFMVEMNEVTNILHNATPGSLILLDEVGRGTSTFDGLSIAWAVSEYIHDRIRARTLFATHYHELTGLAGRLDGAKNYSIAVEERGQDIIFLRQIVPGGTDDSYGIQVARLAGLPPEVIKRAGRILEGLDGGDRRRSVGAEPREGGTDEGLEGTEGAGARKSSGMGEDASVSRVSEDGESAAAPEKGDHPAPDRGRRREEQLQLFETDGQSLIEELRSLDILNMTPLEALNRLHELKKAARGFDPSAPDPGRRQGRGGGREFEQKGLLNA